VHEQKDHTLGARLEMRLLHRQRIHTRARLLFGDQPREGEVAEANA
jgi:hypothetical protein